MRTYGPQAIKPYRAPRRRGQVLIITMLGLTVLVSLIFYVYNIGAVVNRRLELQTVADSTAVSGAGWMARSMNVVAMDNVAMSRLMASVVVLDSLPLATQMSLEELSAWKARLDEQLAAGLPQDKGSTYVKQGLQSLRDRMAGEEAILIPVDAAVNRSGFSMDNTTTWAVRGVGGPPPHGALWQAIVALDELSQSTVASAGLVAQTNATAYAGGDHKTVRQRMGFMTPILPAIPAKRTNMDDFRPTLVGYEQVTGEIATMNATGGPGGAISDVEFPHRLGPWARMYRWRRPLPPIGGTVISIGGGIQIQHGKPNINPGGRQVGGSAMGPSGGGSRLVGGEIPGYYTFGPLQWMLESIDWWANDAYGTTSVAAQWQRTGQLPDTYFHRYMSELSRIKINSYMFPARGQKDRQTYHHPLWITDWSQAHTTAADPSVQVYQTMFYQVQIASSVPETDGNYLSPGTFRTNGQRPIVVWTPGWRDPAKWPVPMICNHVWKDQYTYMTTSDPAIGIQEKLDPNGNPIFQTVYMSCWWVWGGIDVGGQDEVHNPCNWTDADPLPAPILLDTAKGDYDPVAKDPDAGYRRDLFTYLAVAADNTKAPVWSKRFNSGRTPRLGGAMGATTGWDMYALAQAKVFNNSSWDLWTQDWQVQLAPVSQWDDWRARMQASLPDVPAVQGKVRNADVQNMLKEMSLWDQQTVEKYMEH